LRRSGQKHSVEDDVQQFDIGLMRLPWAARLRRSQGSFLRLTKVDTYFSAYKLCETGRRKVVEVGHLVAQSQMEVAPSSYFGSGHERPHGRRPILCGINWTGFQRIRHQMAYREAPSAPGPLFCPNSQISRSRCMEW
jgi:hypothetical protein